MTELVELFAAACGAPVPLVVLCLVALRQEAIERRHRREVEALKARVGRLELVFN